MTTPAKESSDPPPGRETLLAQPAWASLLGTNDDGKPKTRIAFVAGEHQEIALDRGRFYTITRKQIAGSTTLLRPVEIDDLRWLIDVVGPEFLRSHRERVDRPGRDESGSGFGFRFMRDHKAAGRTYEEARAAIMADRGEAGEWARRSDHRQLRRAWERSPDPDPRRAKLDALAKLDELDFAQCEKAEAKAFPKGEISVALLRSKVAERRAEQHAIEWQQAAAAAAEAAETPEQQTRRLAASAAALIASEDVLAVFEREFEQVFAGERNNARLLYLLGTTRLFNACMHGAIKGTSSAGKSELRTRVLDFFPPEDVVPFTSLSEKALLYMGDFEHKILSMGEAHESDEIKFQDMLLRELMSEGVLRYPTVQKIEGELVTTTIEKHGPVAFVVTTTRNKLHPENETRMLSLEVDDSEQQTRAVLRMVAQTVGYGRAAKQLIDFTPWHDFQRWLACGERRVIVPFSGTLSQLIPPKAVRLRRDFAQLLRAVMAHALLHRHHRRRNEDGTIKADPGDGLRHRAGAHAAHDVRERRGTGQRDHHGDGRRGHRGPERQGCHARGVRDGEGRWCQAGS